MNTKTFYHFNEVKDDVAKLVPATIYKYRTWDSELHKGLLTNQQVWFSHPFDLNDPFDVRPEHKFNLKEVEDERYFQMLLNTVEQVHYWLNTDYDKQTIASNRWELTKSDPSHIIETHHQIQSNRHRFDPYGVFSTSMDSMSERLWDEYGNDFSGYCMGFNTVDLCSQLRCSFGVVDYSNQPIQYSFFDRDNDVDTLYRKTTKWNHEKEFRFITAGIGIYSTRLQTFTPETVSEVLIGYNMSTEREGEIIKEIEQNYPDHLPVFKVVRDNSGNLTRQKIR